MQTRILTEEAHAKGSTARNAPDNPVHLAAMNIFWLSRCPAKAARAHCDVHVVKMILETAQLLAAAKAICDNNGEPWPVEKMPVPVETSYRVTHRSHPCVIASCRSRAFFDWLALLGLELCKEYTHRYGKVHKSEAIIRAFQLLSLQSPLPLHPFKKGTTTGLLDIVVNNTRHVITVPLAFSDHPECIVKNSEGRVLVLKSYRKYYISKRLTMKRPMKWTNRISPFPSLKF